MATMKQNVIYLLVDSTLSNELQNLALKCEDHRDGV